jgi:hypothetical protein
MPRAHLQATIQRLRHEIDAGAPLGPDQIDALRGVLGEIETLLESGDAAPAEHESILARLREAEGRFERTHPNFAAAVRSVTDALSKLGI